MGTPAIKHTNEALAFITLYKSMPSEVKDEVKELIVSEAENEEASLFTSLSLKSWEVDDDVEENKIWENFYNSRNDI